MNDKTKLTDQMKAAGLWADKPCKPCGEKQPRPFFENKPPYWVMLGEALHQQECERIIQMGRAGGWQVGTIIDGTPSRNSSVHFTSDEWLLKRMRGLATRVAPLLGIDIWPEKLASVQLGRYLPPSEDYGWHVDHDPSRRHVEYDRKLSLVGALSPSSLEIAGVGVIKMNAGDFLAFGGNVSHQAPPMEQKRYTIVAWIPGPAWR